MMATSAVGFVASIGNNSGDPWNIVQVIVSFMVTSDESISGPWNGQTVIPVDMSQNDSQISLQIRGALADYLNTQFSPNPGLAANNVRGCAI